MCDSYMLANMRKTTNVVVGHCFTRFDWLSQEPEAEGTGGDDSKPE